MVVSTLRGLLFGVIMFMAVSPLAVSAQGLVPCGQTKTTYNTDGTVKSQSIPHPCRFTDLIALARNIITKVIVLGVIVATMGFAYAGYLYITAMGSEEKIRHAHSIFYKVILGFVFLLSAWLIVHTIEQTFLTPAQQERSFLQSGNVGSGNVGSGGGGDNVTGGGANNN